MRLAKGPRPWPIWAFAGLLIGEGLLSLLHGLGSLEVQLLMFQSQWPGFGWSRDWVIVWFSAWFSIVLIPVVALVGFASRIARILVTIMALIASPAAVIHGASLAQGEQSWVAFLSASAVLIAAGLLYLPPASRWLRQEAWDDEQAFD